MALINKVKLLSAEQMITLIKKTGNEKVFDILSDKNLTGQELLELTEFDMNGWKLTSNQKKELLLFLNELKSNSSKLFSKYFLTNETKSDSTFMRGPFMSASNELTHGPDKNISRARTTFLQELNSVVNAQYNQKTLSDVPQYEMVGFIKPVSPNRQKVILPGIPPSSLESINTDGQIKYENFSASNQTNEYLLQMKSISSPHNSPPIPNHKPVLPITRHKYHGMTQKMNDFEIVNEALPINDENLKESKNVSSPVNDVKSLLGVNVHKVKTSPLVDRKPVPLPTRGGIKSIDSMNCRKKESTVNENKNYTEMVTTGKLEMNPLKSNEVKRKQKCSLLCTNIMSDEGIDSPLKKSLMDKQETEYWTAVEEDKNDYLSLLQFPIDDNASQIYPKNSPDNLIEELSKSIKGMAVQRKFMKCRVENRSNLCLIETPSSSDDENCNEKSNKNSVTRSNNKNDINSSKSLPRPPIRMISPVFFIENGDDENSNIIDPVTDPLYLNIDRKGCEKLLSHRQNGAFLFRPSENYFLVLTVKENGIIRNFGIDKAYNGKIHLHSETASIIPTFSSLHEFVDYYCREPIVFKETEDSRGWNELFMNPFLGNNAFQKNL